MINKIYIKKYRKLVDINFIFSSGINVISGTNGTCKTSLLHIISNSFQKPNAKLEKLNDGKIIKTINNVNHSVNPKIESLTKGDTKYNDPAPNIKVPLYKVEYLNNDNIAFRKHNSSRSERYSIKPKYNNRGETLPKIPVIYLSLGRLFNYGEFRDDEGVKKILVSFPPEYQDRIAKNYYAFTSLKITNMKPQKMGDIKNRSSFDTDHEGVDSNTISSGEDNLFIILTALESLRYYFNNIQANNEVESILLIDELDATLHPGVQNKLYDLIKEYARNYKIQVFFTTHSLSLLEHAFKNKDNVHYLINQMTRSIALEEPDIHTIRKHLEHKTGDLTLSQKIPVFLEDDEARDFYDLIIDYLITEKKLKSISIIKSYLYNVDISIGSDNLINLFDDKYLMDTTMKSICILDGDQLNKRNVRNQIIVLPGKDSPEKLMVNYVLQLIEKDSRVLDSNELYLLGYSKPMILEKIVNEISNFEEIRKERESQGTSNKGYEREKYKKLYKDNKKFFNIIMKLWIQNHELEVKDFYDDVKTVFYRCKNFYSIDLKDFPNDESYKSGQDNNE